METYIHGGFSPLTTYDDVYVLSLPSFSWYKVDNTPGTGRTLHTCNVVNRQMIVIGGTSNDDSWLTGDSISGTYQDP
jgi:N-acetylneuraminic acid mutarotase